MELILTAIVAAAAVFVAVANRWDARRRIGQLETALTTAEQELANALVVVADVTGTSMSIVVHVTHGDDAGMFTEGKVTRSPLMGPVTLYDLAIMRRLSSGTERDGVLSLFTPGNLAPLSGVGVLNSPLATEAAPGTMVDMLLHRSDYRIPMGVLPTTAEREREVWAAAEQKYMPPRWVPENEPEPEP